MFSPFFGLLLLTSVFTSSFAASKSPSDGELLANIVQKYRNSKLSTLFVDKRVKSELLETEKLYQGKIFISSGKFRWEIEGPEKSILVYDGTHLWNVQFLPQEFGGDIQVTKSKLSDKAKGQNILSSLFGKEPLQKIFNVKKDASESKAAGETVFNLEPKSESLDIKDLKITTTPKLISQVQYKDEVGNLTVLIFTKTALSSKGSPSLFKYTPPKEAKVTEL